MHYIYIYICVCVCVYMCVKSESVSGPVVSDSVQPHRLQLAKFLCPWNSPGKNTGGQPFSPPGDLLDPGTEPGSPALQADSLPSEPPGKPCGIQFPNQGSNLGPLRWEHEVLTRSPVDHQGIIYVHMYIYFFHSKLFSS